MALFSRADTLRAFDRFLPRITFGKAAPAPVPVPADGAPQRVPPGPDAGNGAGRTADPKGFAYLKRDLVRLLGILSSGRRAVQDRVRACGGLQVVLNLCVVDDRNPCECAPVRVSPCGVFGPATAAGEYLPLDGVARGMVLPSRLSDILADVSSVPGAQTSVNTRYSPSETCCTETRRTKPSSMRYNRCENGMRAACSKLLPVWAERGRKVIHPADNIAIQQGMNAM